MSGLAVITIVHGRREHLELQHAALSRSTDRDLTRVLVAMDDPDVARWRPAYGPVPVVVDVPRTADGRLPLATARNAGAREAMARDADVLVFLDVDCLPDPDLVAGFRLAADDPATGSTLICGPVSYLPPPPDGGYDLDTLDDLAVPHPARPAPERGEVVLGGDHDLFWSLSFGVRAETWRTLGGFSERYAGYGGEDTDFAAKARALGVDLSWVGSARAHHQHHATESPPRQHLVEILDNARVFQQRWGRWPMTGWLDAFVDEGLLVHDAGTYCLP